MQKSAYGCTYVLHSTGTGTVVGETHNKAALIVVSSVQIVINTVHLEETNIFLENFITEVTEIEDANQVHSRTTRGSRIQDTFESGSKRYLNQCCGAATFLGGSGSGS